MIDTFWNIFQQFQIGANTASSETAKELSITNVKSLSNTQNQIDTLVLANQAMWEILSNRLGVSEKELIEKMNEIDLRDGKQDGKISGSEVTVQNCGECGHKVGKRRSHCYWCGATLESSSIFATK